MCHHPGSDYLVKLEESLRKKLVDVMCQEEYFWLIRSRENWILDGDRNTAFFHKSTLVLRKSNRILQLEDSVGNGIDTEQSITDHVLAYFQTLLSTSKSKVLRSDFLTPSHVTQIISVSQTPSQLEVREALFSVGSLKSPGPDDFHSRFYKNQWDLLKGDLVPFIEKIFQSGCVPHGLNDTNIILIPKIDSPISIKKFRPISLCNTIYKVVTKILVSRLKPHLQPLVSPNQNAFIPNRGTDTNMIVASEIIHSMRSRKGRNGWFAFKIDLEKAYDKIEWDFIRSCLDKYEF